MKESTAFLSPVTNFICLFGSHFVSDTIKGSGLPPEEDRNFFFPWEAAVPAPGRKASTGNRVQEVQRS